MGLQSGRLRFAHPADHVARQLEWQQEEIDGSLHEAFLAIVPERENRELLFKSLTAPGNPAETALANLRTAKQVADLYLIQVANRTWRRILDDREAGSGAEPS